MSGLSGQQLAEIAAREAAATEGPWEQYPEYGETFYGYLRGEYLRGVGDINFGVGEQADADLAFVLNAREDVPALLAEIQRRGERIAELEQHWVTVAQSFDREIAKARELLSQQAGGAL